MFRFMSLATLKHTPPRHPRSPPASGPQVARRTSNTAAERPQSPRAAAFALPWLASLVPLAYGLVLAALLAGCGGGGSDNPLDNPATVENPSGSGGRKLSFEYYQRCINPLMLATIVSKGGTSTCASGGCHSDATGTGGALRIRPLAAVVDLTLSSNTPDVTRTTDMYRNFYSSQGVTLVGDPDHSRLINKPLVIGTLHGGGLIFDNEQDEAIQRLRYWITRTMPEGQDEFGSAAASMFTPADPVNGACNVQ
jgi:hypothetical protein